MSLPPEIWALIGQNITNGRDFRSWILVCTDFSHTITEARILELSNPLWSLIIRHPNEDWDWAFISGNPCTTFDIVEKYPHMNYDWPQLMRRLIFPDGFLEEAIQIMAKFPINDEYDYQLYLLYLKVVDNIEYISHNPNIPASFLVNYRKFDKLNMFAINKCAKFSTLIHLISADNSMLNNGILENPTLPMEFLDNVIIDFRMLSYNTGLTYQIFKKYSDKPWHMNALSYNSAVTVEFILAAIDKKWNWRLLSSSPHAISIFLRFPDKLWDYDILSMSVDLSIDILKKYSNKPWNMMQVSIYMKISMDEIRKSPDLDWDYTSLLLNKTISLTDLLDDFILMNNTTIMHKSLENTDMHYYLASCSIDTINELEFTNKFSSQYILSYRSISIDDQKKYPSIEWDYEIMSQYNPKLSWIFVDQYPELFNLGLISFNTFGR